MALTQQQTSLPTHRATVLCIDDDPEISRLIRLRLEPSAVKVISASFGTHGMWVANQELPDVIVTDFQMPQGNGGCLIEWLKSSQRTAAIPVIVLTGRREAGLEYKLRSLGAANFLQKPTSFDVLLQALGEYISVQPEDSSPDLPPETQERRTP